jgi:hypothetical protein
MGRYSIMDRPMTPAERQARSRALQRQGFIERHPEHFAREIGWKLDRLNDVDAVAADKALALIARDIAKRRKALAPALAEVRRKQRALRRFMRGGE